MKKIRNQPGYSIQDPSIIDNLEYNNAAGSKKVSEVGRHLLPIPTASGFTTNCSTALPLPNTGKSIAVFNSAGSVGTVTLGEDGTITSLAAGVTDASGHVGIPCKAGEWTYIACADQQWVITSASTLLVFLVDDNTEVKQESAR